MKMTRYLFGLFFVANVITHANAKEKTPLDIKLDSKEIERVAAPTPTSFAPMLQRTTPSVVSVYTSEVVKVVQSDYNSPYDDLLRQFFGAPVPHRQPRRAEPSEKVEERLTPVGAGSGVIVSRDGYIITNNHVVVGKGGQGAPKITVKLHDGKTLPAKIVGRDPKTDVALIKIEAEDLPAVAIADSDKISVGDIVFAIGNPMRVGTTVTQGIVSARNRSIGIYGAEGYESFIQTDAAINMGNSGGALVDTSGRLIGINSAILSASGGSIGIGFAIPSNLAVSVVRQLAKSGEVKRGFLGIGIKNLDADMAEAFGLDDDVRGVLVDNVQKGLAADKAGLVRGDVITAVNNKAVNNPNELRIRIAQAPPGSTIELAVIRKGQAMTISVVVGDRAQGTAGVGNELFKGITVEDLEHRHREEFGIPNRVDGLVVTEARANSPYGPFLAPGTVIMEINDQRIERIEDARAAIRRGVNKLYVFNNGFMTYIALRVR